MNKWTLVLIYAFLLNLVWENAHQFLYVHYKGGAITELILIRAALVDALIIFGMILVFRLALYHLRISDRYSWFLIFAGISISIYLEYWALAANRWEYTDLMPIIPFIHTGLTPTIQIGLLGYIVYRVVFKKTKSI